MVATLIFLTVGNLIISQNLPTKELIRYPYYNSERIADSLIKNGWETKRVELIADSNYIRRTWVKGRVKDNVKSYFIFYEFTKDSSENYIIYQFSDRPAFLSYKSELKKIGYKLMNKKSRMKMKNTDIITYNEKEDIFYMEKNNAVTIVEEVFIYGLNSFLIYSYKSNSAIAKYILFYH